MHRCQHESSHTLGSLCSGMPHRLALLPQAMVSLTDRLVLMEARVLQAAKSMVAPPQINLCMTL